MEELSIPYISYDLVGLLTHYTTCVEQSTPELQNFWEKSRLILTQSPTMNLLLHTGSKQEGQNGPSSTIYGLDWA